MQDQLLVDRTQQLQPFQTLHGDHQPVAAITCVLPQLIYNRRGQRNRSANAVVTVAVMTIQLLRQQLTLRILSVRLCEDRLPPPTQLRILSVRSYTRCKRIYVR